MALGALSPMLALHPCLLPAPGLPSLEEQSLSSTHSPWGVQAHRHSHYCLYLQERIVKVMDDYQIMDEFHYNLNTDDFNDK